MIIKRMFKLVICSSKNLRTLIRLRKKRKKMNMMLKENLLLEE
jgi:hypothetical protein